jgi:hypothetical protein
VRTLRLETKRVPRPREDSTAACHWCRSRALCGSFYGVVVAFVGANATRWDGAADYRCTTGRPDPLVACSGRIGPARYGPLRATGHTGRTTYGLGPRPRPMAWSTSHFIGPQITRAAFDRATGQYAWYQNKSQINFTRSNMMMKT